MPILMENQTHHVPLKSWNELEWDNSISNKVKETIPNGLWHKAKLFAILTWTSIATLFSSCTNKTVDEQINDLVIDKQEVVDGLNEDLDELTIKLNTAKTELAKAKRKQAVK